MFMSLVNSVSQAKVFSHCYCIFEFVMECKITKACIVSMAVNYNIESSHVIKYSYFTAIRHVTASSTIFHCHTSRDSMS